MYIYIYIYTYTYISILYNLIERHVDLAKLFKNIYIFHVPWVLSYTLR